MSRFKQGLNRLRANWVYVLQAGCAAGLSYWVAFHIFNHEQPFFAPMATVIVLSTTGGERFRRSIELVLGVSLGVGLGDLLIAWFDSGVWQIAVLVSASIAVATVVDKGVLVANQAAFASVLVATILPPGTTGGIDRMLDAFIGGVVGIAVMSVFPESPLRSGRRECANILGLTAQIQHNIALALRYQDQPAIVNALVAARGSQGQINAMISATHTGREAIAASPLLWGHRKKIKALIKILNPIDNAMRDTRVLTRKALILTEDMETVSDAQIELLERLSQVSTALSTLFSSDSKLTDSHKIPELVDVLTDIGHDAGAEVAAGKGLSAHTILDQTRSLCVDLLQVCGLSRCEAIERLAPVAPKPRSYRPLWNED